MYVHALHMRTPDEVRRSVGQLERRILWMVR
jgi:hypothetical protein